MSTHWRLGLFFGLLTAVPSASQSQAPLVEVRLHAGYDEMGGSWTVSSGRSQPLVVVGPRAFTPALRSPLDFMELRATIDGGTLWIADGSPRVVSVALADGSTRETRLPLPRVSQISARGGLLFAGFYDAGMTGVLRFDPASGRSETIFDARLPKTLLATSAGPSRMWIATWTGLGAPRVQVELAGIPVSSGSKLATRRATREVDWAAERWSGFAVREDDEGNVWLAHTYAGRVERLDPSGAWTSWTVAPERVVSLATLGTRAVVLVAAMAPEDPFAPPGISRTNRSTSLLVIDPASRGLTRTPLAEGTPAESLSNAGGRVWIANGREVKIVAGRAITNEVK